MDTNDLIRYYGLLCISSVFITPNITNPRVRWVFGFAYFALATTLLFTN